MPVPVNLWRFLGARKNQPFVPFPAQAEMLSAIRIPWPGYTASGAPYPSIFGLNCGRRGGKTEVLEKLCWAGVTAPDDEFGPPTVRVTADTEEHGRKVWDRFLWHLENTPLVSLLKSHSRERDLITLTNDATIQLLSANNPQALAGDGVTTWVVDEAQYLTQAAFDNLFPSVSERNGVIVMAGVSEGEGPFREVCWKGERRREYPEFLRLSYPSAANPYVSRRMIDLASRTLPAAKFKQLYLAQWVNEIGRIFRNPEAYVVQREVKEHPSGFFYTALPQPGHTYWGGLDIGRLQDWTVQGIMNRDGELIAWDTYSLIGWEQQKARMAQLSGFYSHPPTMMDTTGIGDPVYQDLSRMGLNLLAYQISSNQKKVALIDNLAIRLGARAFRYPQIKELLDQLERFEARRAKAEMSTVIQYSAPVGMHDDWVMMLALLAQVFPQWIPESQDETDRVASAAELFR
jgi:hypothetical protein